MPRNPWQILRGTCLLALPLLLSACSTTPAPPRPGAVLLPVQLFPDDGEKCGPASLAGVLSFWGMEASMEEIAEAIYSKNAGGTLNHDMLWYADERGLEVTKQSGSMQQLRACIDAGIPVIVMIDYGRGVLSYNHFMVITGYDADGVYANSTTHQNERFSSRKLRSVWKPHDNWMMIARPADHPLPDLAHNPIELLKRGFQLERQGDEAEALRHYQLSAEQNQPEAFLMIGNFYHQRQQLEEAEAAYRQALALKPEDGNILNNLASTLLAREHKLEEAERLIRQAITLYPESRNIASYQETLSKVVAYREQQSTK